MKKAVVYSTSDAEPDQFNKVIHSSVNTTLTVPFNMQDKPSSMKDLGI